MSGLPGGWESEKLSTIATRITKGSTPTSYGFGYQSHGISFVKVENLERGRINQSSFKHFISEEANSNQRRSILEAGDILFSIAGTIGATCLVTENDLPANTNQALAIIKGTLSVFDPSFLRYQLESEVTQKQADNRKRGGGMFNVSLTDVGNLDMLVAPLDEQKRIVEKLEKLVGKVEAVQERLDKIPVILKRFRQSVLAAACSGKLTSDWRELYGFQTIPESKDGMVDDDHLPELPSTWHWSVIGEIGTAKGGKRLPKGEALVNDDTGQPYIKAGNLKNGTVSRDGIQFVPDHIKDKIKNYKVNTNDVYITIVGACIGDAGIVPHDFDGANLTENAAKICNLLETDAKFLAFWLRSPTCQSYIQDNILSAAQGKLALFRIEQLPTPICSIEEQKEIVRRIEDLFKFADQIEERYKKSRSYTDKLTQSILAKAFRGELVPQDPNDEPASVLLERIAAQRRVTDDGSRPAAS
jgi:type I restriction enzyme S subunit